jgi:ribosomal protein S18 acetylase RimI-like enzyme
MNRYKIDFYQEKTDYKKLIALGSEEFNVPSHSYLRDIALVIRDNKNDTLVGFICAIVGLGDTASISHLMLHPSLRKTKIGAFLLTKLWRTLNNLLYAMNKTAYEGFVNEDNKVAINLYKKHGGKRLAKGYLYRKEIVPNEKFSKIF